MGCCPSDVTRLVVQGEEITVERGGDQDPAQTRKEPGESVLDTLRALGVSEAQLERLPIVVESAPNTGAFFNWLIMLLPMILIFGFFIFIMRQVAWRRGRTAPCSSAVAAPQDG
ncbi:MAG: hypothetical protein R2856_24540 [Caldilineaceae bacterium]